MRGNRGVNAVIYGGIYAGTVVENMAIHLVINADESLGGNQKHLRAPSARVFLCPSMHLFALP